MLVGVEVEVGPLIGEGADFEGSGRRSRDLLEPDLEGGGLSRRLRLALASESWELLESISTSSCGDLIIWSFSGWRLMASSSGSAGTPGILTKPGGGRTWSDIRRGSGWTR